MTGPTRASRSPALRLNAIYISSFLASAAVVAFGFFGVGLLVPDHLRLSPAVAGVVLLFFAACDFRLGPLRTITLNRQTVAAWRHRFGIPRATAFWGLDIGTTLTTIKMTSFYWAAFVLIFTGPAARPHWVVAFFAAGYLITHGIIIWRVYRDGGSDAVVGVINDLPGFVRRTSGVALTILGTVMIVQAISDRF